MTLTRRWAPLAAFLVLAGAWLTANALGLRASLDAVGRANALMLAATGHVATSGSSTDGSFGLWAPFVLHGLLPAMGAAALAVAIRASRRGLWFLAAAIVPFAVSGADYTGGWARPGAGIAAYVGGAGFGSLAPGRELDFTSYGAGPSWLLWAGTALTLAVVLVPALLVAPPAPEAAVTRPVARAAMAVVPYAMLVGMAVLTYLGVTGATSSGGDQMQVMLFGGLAASGMVVVGAVLLTTVSGRMAYLAAAGLALVAVGSTRSGAGLSTQLAIALATVACVGVAAASLRPRGSLRGRVGTKGPAPTQA